MEQMNWTEIALRHPDLLERILAKSTGILGEIIVADELEKLGYTVQPTNNNAKQSDLLVTSPNGEEFSVEVKADRQRRPTWFVRVCPDPTLSQIWCLVSAPRKADGLPDPNDIQIFVLKAEEAATIWQSSEWNQKNPTKGDLRRWQIPDGALFDWDKLPK